MIKKTVFILLCASLFSIASFAQIMQTVNGKQYTYIGNQWKYYDPVTSDFFPIDSTIRITFDSTAPASTVAAFILQNSLTLINNTSKREQHYSLPSGSDPFQKAISIGSSPLVDSVRLNISGQFCYFPNDVQAIGTGTLVSLFNQMRLYDAWDITKGNIRHPVVAVLDNGFDYTHEDIGLGTDGYSNIWINDGNNGALTHEDNGCASLTCNGIDDDNNNIIDDIFGANYPNNIIGVSGPGNDPSPLLFSPTLPYSSAFSNQSYIYQNLHGTVMAGLIGAKLNNYTNATPPNFLPRNILAGVAGGDASASGGSANKAGCRLMLLKVNQYYQDGPSLMDLYQSVDYAVVKNAKIINMSFRVGFDANFHQSLIAADSKDIICVGAAGNGSGCTGYPGAMAYPAVEDFVIAVGAANENGYRQGFSMYGPKLDIMAPSGSAGTACGSIPTSISVAVPMSLQPIANPGPGYAFYPSAIATSGAAALVSGVCALMLDVNPCLKPAQVDDILKMTAQKTHSSAGPLLSNPSSIWYNYYGDVTQPGRCDQMGYGIVDAGRAVKAAQDMYQPAKADLYIKDNPSDFGAEPDNSGSPAWESPDIYVRNQPDGLLAGHQYHQNPIYHITNGVQDVQYIYVRVRNKSCNDFTGSQSEKVQLYWAHSNTGIVWPNTFSISTSGGQIGSQAIGAITRGNEKIFVFPWQPPNPVNNSEPGELKFHYCFIALTSPRDPVTGIVPTADPITYDVAPGSSENANTYVVQNNNVAQKNVTLIDPSSGLFSGGIYIGNNPFQHITAAYRIRSSVPADRANVFDQAQVQLQLDSLSWAKWNDGGRQGTAIEVASEQERIITLRDTSAEISGLSYDYGEQSALGLAVHFLSDSAAAPEQSYALRLTQYTMDSNEVFGGETFEIRREPRSTFDADAGPDKTINLNQIVTLAATSINENAQYKWYDPAGNLVDSGQSIQVSPQVTEEYRLVVIANADGFTDWDVVKVKVRNGHIASCYPNPVTSSLNVGYALENVSSAYLLITQPYSNAVSSYILNPSGNLATINMSGFASGVYNVLLICDGNIVDATTIQKQ